MPDQAPPEDTHKIPETERLDIEREAKDTGENPVAVATRRLAKSVESETSERELVRARTLGQLNVALQHAGQLRNAQELQAVARQANDEDALTVRTRLIEELTRHAPIVVPRELDRPELRTKFAQALQQPSHAESFAGGLVQELDTATFRRLDRTQAREELLREPRVLVLAYDGTNFSVVAKSLRDVVRRALTSAAVTVDNLDQAALTQLGSDFRASIERRAEPKK